MRILARAVYHISRRTEWAEGHVFAFAPEQFALSDGFRTASVVGLMFAAEIYFGIPELAFAAIAAFWTTLCDPLDASVHRLKVMLAFAVLGAIVTALAVFGAHFNSGFNVLIMTGLVFVSLLTRTYSATFGPGPAQSGLIVAIAAVVGFASPRDFAGAIAIGGSFMAGSLLMMLVAMIPRAKSTDNPGALGAVAVFSRLDKMLDTILDLDTAKGDDPRWWELETRQRKAVRFAIERARGSAASQTSGPVNYENLIIAASRLFSSLVAIGHYRQSSQKAFEPEHEIPALLRLREAIGQMSAELESDRIEPSAFADLGRVLEAELPKLSGSFADAMSLAARAMVEFRLHWNDPLRAPEQASVGHPEWKISPVAFQHALRASLAATISYLIGVWMGVELPYWGAIATLVVMQPLVGNTFLRVLERAVGGIIGGAIAAIAITEADTHLEMAVLIVPLCVVVIALRLVNYGLFVIFLTPMFMLMTDYVHSSGHLIDERILNEVRGAVIGIVAGICFWPLKAQQTTNDALAAAIGANLRFAAATQTRGGSAEQLKDLERQAGIASSRLETTYERLWLEGKGTSQRLAGLRSIALALRNLCGAAALAGQSDTSTEPDQERADFYNSLSVDLTETVRLRTVGIHREADPSRDDLARSVARLTAAVDDYTGGVAKVLAS